MSTRRMVGRGVRGVTGAIARAGPPRRERREESCARLLPSRPVSRAVKLSVLVLLVATIAGACGLWFLCDDAYITFRYVSNARDGHGLVWNPPPFLPVEGYTGFSWAILLWAVWSWFGIEPPDSANVMSIAFGVCQFAVIVFAAFRLRGRDGERLPDSVALAAVACIVAQRTFLQWMTSGLETALFNFAFVSWAPLGFRVRESRGTKWLALWSAAAATAALTRPDGLLLVAATVGGALVASGRPNWRSIAAGLAPLVTVAAHVAWRRSFYGEWLPNTYYAKIVAPWPEAGIPYFECFLFEHGLWLWFPVAAVWAVAWSWRHRSGIVRELWARAPALVVLGVISFHTGYYILKVGGDHFEYRVLSQLVPLAWLSFAVMCAQLLRRVGAVLAALGTMLVFSSLGWIHLAASGDMTMNGINPIADKLPAVLRPLWRWHDAQQMLLHIHFVCLRCNQHRIARDVFVGRYPPRGKFAPEGYDDVPVLIEGVVGVAGWVMRDVAIIDNLGLNDWVVARTRGLDWHTAPEYASVFASVRGSDLDHDGTLTREEVRGWVGALFGGKLKPAEFDPFLDMVFLLFAHERPDALNRAETDAFVQGLFSRGAMAHERIPPPGYTEAFEPNVAPSPTAVVVTPRAVPLKPRIPAIEAEWRAKRDRGELKVR